jgi:hypothetical protein
MTVRALVVAWVGFCPGASGADFVRVHYNNPGLVVDLGVGLWAWPMPMDWDGDGDYDLVVSCPDVPFNGVYLFENPGGEAKMPVFKPPVRVGDGMKNVQVSHLDGKPRVLTPHTEWTGFLGKGFAETRKVAAALPKMGKTRAQQWHLVDYDGDGDQDLVVGIGEWTEYGWDDAYDGEGNWTRGPLRGWVFLLRNKGTSGKPEYEKASKIQAGGKPVDVYGMPSPNFADFDGDGDLDLICGEFLDGFTYFRNEGTRTEPRYAKGQRLMHKGQPIAMHVQMITPSALDWDRDGDVDLVVGDEDGRVALMENTGRMAGNLPGFLPPVYFQQEAGDLKFGALVTPVSVDWDGDGDEDLVCGNTSGNIGWFENLDGGNPPKWSRVKLLEAGGEIIHLQAGPNGSIQGPAEAKWGYSTLSVADWDHDGDSDLVVNSIWGKVIWYENTGTSREPKLAASQAVMVEWSEGASSWPAWNWWKPQGNELVTQWRTTPLVVDWNKDGLNDLVMLDHEGFLALYERKRKGAQLLLGSPRRSAFQGSGKGEEFLRLNERSAGKSGRRKMCVVDWDGDGDLDLLLNSANATLLHNVSGGEGPTRFVDRGPLGSQRLAGHTTSPTTVDWDRDGVRDLLVGAEDGRFYYLKQKRVDPMRIGSFLIEGGGFEVATLDNGQSAYGNREYTWFDVPDEFRGGQVTRTSGGVRAVIRVTCAETTMLRMATAAVQKGVSLEGWKKVEGMEFGYSDQGRTRMVIFERNVKAGETLEIPQGNWSGGLVLLPRAK